MTNEVCTVMREGPEQARRVVGFRLRDGSEIMLHTARALAKFRGERYVQFVNGRYRDVPLFEQDISPGSRTCD